MWDLTEDQRDLRALAARVAAEQYAPRAREWDAGRVHLPEAERKRLADLGLLALTLPEEFGGGGRPLIDALIVLEELAKASPVAAWPVFEASTGQARVIDLFGSDEQRKRILPEVASGKTTIAVSISEPDAGSAATDVMTSARVEGDEVVLTGAKRWCSGAGFSEKYLVYVRFGPEKGAAGMGAVLIDRDTPGLTFGAQENLMGFRGIGSADMFLSDVRVPVADVIIPKGGFRKLFTAFSIERLGNATMSLAVGQTALDPATARYVRQRRQFGREISEFQMVQSALADMVVQVEAARLLIMGGAVNAEPVPRRHSRPRWRNASPTRCEAGVRSRHTASRGLRLFRGVRSRTAAPGRARVGRWPGAPPRCSGSGSRPSLLGRRFDQRGERTG